MELSSNQLKYLIRLKNGEKDSGCNYNSSDINMLLKEKIVVNEKITKKGMKVLNGYKVDNAIILAAGMSTRFAPLSYEKPKGLTKVKGEVLIERQIRQLKDAGIEEIIIVLGHALEQFVYLKEKYNIKIVVNNEYKYKNTQSSLFAARDFLKNTYILCADNYYPDGLFNLYENHAYTSTQFMPGIEEGERGVVTNKEGLIVYTERPSNNKWVMNGYQYFDKKFSDKFKKILEDYHERKEADQFYWERIYAEHVSELNLYEKRFKEGEILEFDTLQDLERFDPDFLKNNNYEFIKNISKALGKSDIADNIKNIKTISKGLTNKTISFSYNDSKYVYRFPGKDLPEKIDREYEKKVQEKVKLIGIDDSYIYEDEKKGWKISHYIEAKEKFDFKKEEHIELLCDTVRKLVSAKIKTDKRIDYIDKSRKVLNKIKLIDTEKFEELNKYFKEIVKINKMNIEDNWPIQLCHNDIWEDNLIISNENKLFLIDWEYAEDNDIGYDISRIFVKTGCEVNEIDKYLKKYYMRKPTEIEKKHILGCVVVFYYYWYIWVNYMILNEKNYDDYLKLYLNLFTKYYNEYKKIYKEVI